MANAQEKIDCSKPQRQQTSNWCEQQASNRADQLLNDHYMALLSRLNAVTANNGGVLSAADSKRINAVKESERMWLKYRDTQRHAAGDEYEGGTHAPWAYSHCLNVLTEQRLKALQEVYADVFH